MYEATGEERLTALKRKVAIFRWLEAQDDSLAQLFYERHIAPLVPSYQCMKEVDEDNVTSQRVERKRTRHSYAARDEDARAWLRAMTPPTAALPEHAIKLLESASVFELHVITSGLISLSHKLWRSALRDHNRLLSTSLVYASCDLPRSECFSEFLKKLPKEVTFSHLSVLVSKSRFPANQRIQSLCEFQSQS